MQLQIDRLSFGGEGVARGEDGRVVFVRGALPGDVVEVEIVETHKSFARARVVERLTPSSSRVPADCPVADRCGGCQLWALSAEDAWRLKADAAIDALRRAGRIELPEQIERVAAPSDRRYRRRLRLRIDDAGRSGFFEAGSHELCPVDDCLVAHPALIAARDELAPALSGLGGGKLLLELDRNGVSVVALLEVKQPRRACNRLERLFEGEPLTHLKGVRLPIGRSDRVFGRVGFNQEIAGWHRALSVGAFTQANEAINARLVELVVESLAPTSDDQILELYCGAGNFSLSLASAGATVKGLELNRQAIEAAGRSARTALGDRAAARLHLGVRDLNHGLTKRTATRGAFNKILLDPPRSGAKAAIKGILAIEAEKIVYVSCDPPTLGRDLGRLVSGGYSVERLVALNMFPRTYHVEMMAVLTLS